jgi:hypothetical protein
MFGTFGKRPNEPLTLEGKLEMLAECGLSLAPPFTAQDLLESWPREEFEKPGFNLALIGLGMTEERAPWRNHSVNVWHFDTECIEDNGSCVRIAQRMAELTQGSPRIENPRDQVDLEAGIASLDLEHSGKPVHIDFEVKDDWVGPAVFSHFGSTACCIRPIEGLPIPRSGWPRLRNRVRDARPFRSAEEGRSQVRAAYLTERSVLVDPALDPIVRSISEWRTVARLSVMMTESRSKPEPTADWSSNRTITRLGCSARDMLLVIIAKSVCGRFPSKSSASTIRAGRRFEVRKLESGKRTRTISPRRQVIVDGHLRPIPILRKRR